MAPTAQQRLQAQCHHHHSPEELAEQLVALQAANNDLQQRLKHARAGRQHAEEALQHNRAALLAAELQLQQQQGASSPVARPGSPRRAAAALMTLSRQAALIGVLSTQQAALKHTVHQLQQQVAALADSDAAAAAMMALQQQLEDALAQLQQQVVTAGQLAGRAEAAEQATGAAAHQADALLQALQAVHVTATAAAGSGCALGHELLALLAPHQLGGSSMQGGAPLPGSMADAKAAHELLLRQAILLRGQLQSGGSRPGSPVITGSRVEHRVDRARELLQFLNVHVVRMQATLASLQCSSRPTTALLLQPQCACVEAHAGSTGSGSSSSQQQQQQQQRPASAGATACSRFSPYLARPASAGSSSGSNSSSKQPGTAALQRLLHLQHRQLQLGAADRLQLQQRCDDAERRASDGWHVLATAEEQLAAAQQQLVVAEQQQAATEQQQMVVWQRHAEAVQQHAAAEEQLAAARQELAGVHAAAAAHQHRLGEALRALTSQQAVLDASADQLQQLLQQHVVAQEQRMLQLEQQAQRPATLECVVGCSPMQAAVDASTSPVEELHWQQDAATMTELPDATPSSLSTNTQQLEAQLGEQLDACIEHLEEAVAMTRRRSLLGGAACGDSSGGGSARSWASSFDGR